MKRFIGAVLLLSVFGAMFAMGVAELGLLRTIAAWATVLGLVVVGSLGIWLLLD